MSQPARTIARAVIAVRDAVDGDPVALTVGMVIATELDAAGVADLGVRRLAEITGYHTATVGRAVARLALADVVEVIHTTRGNRYKVRAQSAHPAEQVVRAQSARSRVVSARSRAQSAHPVPVVVVPVSVDQRETKKPPPPDRPAELLAHAAAALDLLAGYVTAEASDRAGIRNRAAYRASIVRRVTGELVALQHTVTDPAELAERIAGTTGQTAEVADVARRLAEAAGGDMARQTTGDVDELSQDPTFYADADRARAAFAAGLANVSRET